MDSFLWTKYFFVTCEKMVTNTKFDTWTFWINAITAISTFLSVVIALYAVLARKWFQKPCLNIEISEEAPNCIEVEDKIEVEDEKRQKVEICGSIKNENAYLARDCKVICKKICVKNAIGEKYVETQKIRPFSFPWSNVRSADERVDISRSLQRFFKFAELSVSEGENERAPKGEDKPPEQKKCKSKSKTPNNEKLSLLTLSLMFPDKTGSNRIIPFRQNETTKEFLIVCSLACLETDPEDFGIELIWKGKSIKDIKDKSLFQVCKISSKKLKEKMEK